MAQKTKKIRVRLVKSVIGQNPNKRKTVKALGLGRINSTVEVQATPQILGMVNTVAHIVAVEEI
jgi:large subunit ribosomal protein L30